MKKIFTILSMFFAVAAMNAQNATIILEAHDVWGDGTGYQILLDADATEYANFPTNYECGTGDYSPFEYKIPSNAIASNDYVVFDTTETLEIPAGIYDFVIVNPSCQATPPYNIIWIANSQCDSAKMNDYNFLAGYTYHFSIALHPDPETDGDCVTLTINGGVGINEIASNKVSIYPNPVNDVLNVNAAGFDKVEIVNFLGQVVYSNQVTATDFQINTADLTAGVYFVRLSGDNIVTKKFVKE